MLTVNSSCPQVQQQQPADRQLHQQQPETACNNKLQWQQLPASAGSSSLQQQQGPPMAANSSLQQQPAATAPVLAAATTGLVISPRMTRSRKKRKAASPASPADCSVLEQVDGAATSPPLPPEECRPPAAPSSPGRAGTTSPTPLVPWAPPPAPPWSRSLPSYSRAVICTSCLKGHHSFGFRRCHDCFNKGIKPPSGGAGASLQKLALSASQVVQAETRAHALCGLRKHRPTLQTWWTMRQRGPRPLRSEPAPQP